MALTSEWRGRVEAWRRELGRHFYQPLGTVELTGFVTKERLSAQEALQRSFAPMPTGTVWGGKWEYGWFKGTIQIPEQADGRRIVLRLDVSRGEAGPAARMPKGAFSQRRKKRPATTCCCGRP